jgi:hypothetical protein
MFGWRGRTRLASDVAARFAVGVLPLFKSDFAMSGIHSMADENVLRLYDSIREQASADIRLGGRHRLWAKQRDNRRTDFVRSWTAVACSTLQLYGASFAFDPRD